MKAGLTKTVLAAAAAILMFTVVTAASTPRTVQAYSEASMIMFQVKGGQFRYLRIYGTDQYGRDQFWHTNWTASTSNVITYGKRWQGFLRLEFYTDDGWRMCTVDNLRVYGTISLVRYYKGMGCSGGSELSMRTMTKERLEQATLTSRDAAKVAGLLGYAYDMFGCTQDIAEGLVMGAKSILLSDSCWGVVVEDLNMALSYTGKSVKMAPSGR